MSAKMLPGLLFERLESLEPDELDLVMDFVEFLQYKKRVRRELAETKPNDDLGWTPGFFERTAGAWQGEPLERGDQGECDSRE